MRCKGKNCTHWADCRYKSRNGWRWLCDACNIEQPSLKAKQHRERAEWAAQEAADAASPAQKAPHGEAVAEAKAKAEEAGTTVAGNEAADDAVDTDLGLKKLPRKLSPACIDEDDSEDNSWGEWGPKQE